MGFKPHPRPARSGAKHLCFAPERAEDYWLPTLPIIALWASEAAPQTDEISQNSELLAEGNRIFVGNLLFYRNGDESVY